MTTDEARELATKMGALEPQGIFERAAAGNMAFNGESFADTERARGRLEAWTQDILAGRNPTNGQPL